MRKILITGIGGDVACAIIRCLLDGFMSDEIYGMDIKRYTPYMDNIKKALVAPRFIDDEYLPFLKDILLTNQITHFLPTTEQEILIADKERTFFRNNGIKLLINNRNIVNICTSKYRTSQFLLNNGICCPVTYLADEYNGELGFPFIMKADKGSGGKALQIIQDEQQWEKAGKSHMVCQELIGDADNEFTVGVFSDMHEVRSIVLKRRLGLGNMSVDIQCCDIPAISILAEKTARAFELKGCFNIQLRKQENKYYIFEINPRLSSTTGFRHKLGFQDAVWWFYAVDGVHIPEYKNSAIGRRGIKVVDDIIFANDKLHGGGY